MGVCYYSGHANNAGCSHTLQKVSLQGSVHHAKQPWSDEEDEFIIDTINEPLLDVADVLGRSYYATATRRMTLRKRGLL